MTSTGDRKKDDIRRLGEDGEHGGEGYIQTSVLRVKSSLLWVKRAIVLISVHVSGLDREPRLWPRLWPRHYDQLIYQLLS